MTSRLVIDFYSIFEPIFFVDHCIEINTFKRFTSHSTITHTTATHTTTTHTTITHTTITHNYHTYNHHTQPPYIQPPPHMQPPTDTDASSSWSVKLSRSTSLSVALKQWPACLFQQPPATLDNIAKNCIAYAASDKASLRAEEISIRSQEYEYYLFIFMIFFFNLQKISFIIFYFQSIFIFVILSYSKWH